MSNRTGLGRWGLVGGRWEGQGGPSRVVQQDARPGRHVWEAERKSMHAVCMCHAQQRSAVLSACLLLWAVWVPGFLFGARALGYALQGFFSVVLRVRNCGSLVVVLRTLARCYTTAGKVNCASPCARGLGLAAARIGCSPGALNEPPCSALRAPFLAVPCVQASSASCATTQQRAATGWS